MPCLRLPFPHAVAAAALTHPAETAGSTLSRDAGEGAERGEAGEGDAVLRGGGN
jgi:hypothetical protein